MRNTRGMHSNENQLDAHCNITAACDPELVAATTRHFLGLLVERAHFCTAAATTTRTPRLCVVGTVLVFMGRGPSCKDVLPSALHARVILIASLISCLATHHPHHTPTPTTQRPTPKAQRAARSCLSTASLVPLATIAMPSCACVASGPLVLVGGRTPPLAFWQCCCTDKRQEEKRRGSSRNGNATIPFSRFAFCSTTRIPLPRS